MGISPLTKAKMIELGTGYNFWVKVVDKMLSPDKLGKFLTVADEAKKDPLLIASISSHPTSIEQRTPWDHH
jgi:hypothetical protein